MNFYDNIHTITFTERVLDIDAFLQMYSHYRNPSLWRKNFLNKKFPIISMQKTRKILLQMGSAFSFLLRFEYIRFQYTGCILTTSGIDMLQACLPKGRISWSAVLRMKFRVTQNSFLLHVLNFEY